MIEQSHIQNVRSMIDVIDDTPLGKVGKLLDRMAGVAQRAVNAEKVLIEALETIRDVTLAALAGQPTKRRVPSMQVEVTSEQLYFSNERRTGEMSYYTKHESEFFDNCCVACNMELRAGILVYNEMDGGYIHAKCCGADRRNYYGLDEKPLAPSDPLPTPFKWTAP